MSRGTDTRVGSGIVHPNSIVPTINPTARAVLIAKHLVFGFLPGLILRPVDPVWPSVAGTADRSFKAARISVHAAIAAFHAVRSRGGVDLECSTDIA